MQPATPIQDANWLSQAWQDPLMWACLVLSVASMGLLCVVVSALYRFGAGDRAARRMRLQHRAASLLHDQQASASLEFVLVLPVFFFLIFLLAQSVLVMVSNQFVHYAGFAATRAAIVKIAADYPDEPTDVVNVHTTTSQKLEGIRRAAVFAVMPAAGRLTAANAVDDTDAADIVAALGAWYANDPPPWLATLAADRFRYADANTQIHLLRTFAEDENIYHLELPTYEAASFGPKEPITVRVYHRVALTMPWVGLVFVSNPSDPGSYEHAPDTGEGLYRWVAAQYTLNNEGVDMNLPPAPTFLHPIDDIWQPLERRP